MTVEEFKAVVNHYGEENIIGFVFDNSSRKLVDNPGDFKLSDHPLDQIGCLEFNEKDGRGHTYKTITHVENIQKILVADDPSIWDALDKRYLGS